MNKDLEFLKKKYGENFAKLCRELFPSLLEKKGLLPSLITKNFGESKFLYEDLKSNDLEYKFKNHIYTCVEKDKRVEKGITESPAELMKKAGYTLYKCETNSDVKAFKKYWKHAEELCTFRDDNRINSHLVFFAVKDNANLIKRQNFANPLRQDEYGTSVIGIQFTKSIPSTLSIKNRYNHTVENPDATFSNDLENIQAGLTESFVKEFKLNLVNTKSGFEIPGYVLAQDEKFYKYNHEMDNVYYCPNNIIINQNREVKCYNKDKFLVFEHFVLDLAGKQIIKDNKQSSFTSFTNGIKDIKKIKVQKLDESKVLTLTPKKGQDIVIELDKTNKIIQYTNPNITNVGDEFLISNRTIKELNLPKLTKAGDYFLYSNNKITNLNLPSLTEAGDNFLYWNKKIEELNLPALKKTGITFLMYNNSIKKLDLPNLTKVGSKFLYGNMSVYELHLPSLKKTGSEFLTVNNKIKELNLPNLIVVGDQFLAKNECVEKLNLPKLIKVGKTFLRSNKLLTQLNLPSLIEVGYGFLDGNKALKKISAPKLIKVGRSFLCGNKELKILDLPKLNEVGDEFLLSNESLTHLNAPKLAKTGNNFLYENISLKVLNISKISKGSKFCFKNHPSKTALFSSKKAFGYKISHKDKGIEL